MEYNKKTFTPVNRIYLHAITFDACYNDIVVDDFS